MPGAISGRLAMRGIEAKSVDIAGLRLDLAVDTPAGLVVLEVVPVGGPDSADPLPLRRARCATSATRPRPVGWLALLMIGGDTWWRTCRGSSRKATTWLRTEGVELDSTTFEDAGVPEISTLERRPSPSTPSATRGRRSTSRGLHRSRARIAVVTPLSDSGRGRHRQGLHRLERGHRHRDALARLEGVSRSPRSHRLERGHRRVGALERSSTGTSPASAPPRARPRLRDALRSRAEVLARSAPTRAQRHSTLDPQ